MGIKDWALVGFENTVENGCGTQFNFIMSDGKRTRQKSGTLPDWPMKEFMMGKKSEQIRKVEFFSWDPHCLHGLKFYDGSNNLILSIGRVDHNKKTLMIASDERIVGVKARLFGNWQAVYTDF